MVGPWEVWSEDGLTVFERQPSESETLPSAGEGASSAALRVATRILGNTASEPGARVPQLTDRTYDLRPLFIDTFIFYNLLMETLTPQEVLEALKVFCKGFPEISKFLGGMESRPIWRTLYENLQLQYPTVINLDELGAGRLLGIPAYEGPESLESIKRSAYILAQAGLLAKHSEDGKSVIVTIPKDWSIDKLETMSRAAIEAGIASAEIKYYDPSYRTVLKSCPIEKERRVAISNTVITGSRSKSTAGQKELLKDKGLEEEFPDALTVLTVAVLRRVLTNGAESSYGRVSQRIGTYTRTNKKTPGGWTLCVSSTPSCVYVSDFHSDYDFVGAGGLRKFPVLGT